VAARLTGGRSSLVQHNVEWQRLADTTALDPENIARLRSIELGLCRAVHDVIAVSAVDRDVLVQAGLSARNVTVLPHGVDVDAFRYATAADLRGQFQIEPTIPILFFHGTLHYEPNTVALRMLADEILPRFQRAGVEVRVVAAGMNPPPEITHPWLITPGVIDDLAAAIAAADVCVVPLLAGGGTRLKILEYLAAGRPTVSTFKGAEGLRLRDGEEITLVHDGAWDDLVDRTRRLLHEPHRAREMGAAASRFARRYDWYDICQAYVQLYRGRGRGADFSGGVAPDASAAATVDVAAIRGGIGRATGPMAGGGPRHLDLEQILVSHLPRTPDWTKPRTAIVLLNRRCNLRCVFCDHWHFRDELPRPAVDALIDQAPGVGVRVLVLTGGEPFLRRDLFEIVDAARGRGLSVNITTNGTMIERRMRQLAAHPPQSISVSVDGLDGTHDRLRGRPGTAERAWRGIERVLAETDIAVNVYFVVTGANVGELTAVHDRARALGAGFDFWPVNGHPDLAIGDEDGGEAYRAAIEHVKRLDPRRRAHAAYYDYGLQYLEGRRDHVRCLGLVEQFGVDHTGRVVPCCVWGIEDMAVGTLPDQPLAEILASRRATAVRRAIVERGCLDRCFNHSLYEFEQATGLPFLVGAAAGGDAGGGAS
jgi:MoaA/NifB/PqqE/SkfB family radical SAM enzyme